MILGLATALATATALTHSASAQQRSISANIADAADFGTLNVDAAYGFARHWSAHAGAKYNPFAYGSGESAVQRKQRMFSAGARYWPWHIFSGWWISGKAQWQEYNSGGIRSPETTEGDRIGAGLAGGYSYMLTPWLNLDIGAGFWAGWSTYRVYACPTCGRVLASGGKYFLLPNEITLALAFVF